MTEPATSKELQTPPQYSHQRAKQQMVDLTVEDEEVSMVLTTGETMPKNHIHNRHTKKYNGKKRRTPSIHWREAEVKNFDPDSPATPMPTVASVMTGNSHQKLPPLFPQPPPTTFFAHAPPPTPTTAPNSTHTPNPFVDNRHYPPGIAIALPPQHSSAQLNQELGTTGRSRIPSSLKGRLDTTPTAKQWDITHNTLGNKKEKENL